MCSKHLVKIVVAIIGAAAIIIAAIISIKTPEKEKLTFLDFVFTEEMKQSGCESLSEEEGNQGDDATILPLITSDPEALRNLWKNIDLDENLINKPKAFFFDSYGRWNPDSGALVEKIILIGFEWDNALFAQIETWGGQYRINQLNDDRSHDLYAIGKYSFILMGKSYEFEKGTFCNELMRKLIMSKDR